MRLHRLVLVVIAVLAIAVLAIATVVADRPTVPALAALGLLAAAATVAGVLLVRIDRLRRGLVAISRRQRGLLAAMPDLIVVIGRDGLVRDVHGDPAALTVAPRQAIGGQPGDCLPGVLVAHIRSELAGPSPEGPGLESIDYRIGAGGCERDFTARFTRATSDELLVAITDTTQRRRLEERLLQGERLTAMGRLAGGIAHDFNNLLTGIMGYADLLRRRLQDDPRGERHAAAVVAAATRAAELTGQLMTLSRTGVRPVRDLDLHEVITATCDMLQRTVDPRIAIIAEPAAQFSTIAADPGRLQSALLNLGINARDAMPAGGTLRFSTADTTAPGPGIPRGLVPGIYCRLTVSDTGIGMDERVRSHLFEPFFTTKEAGRGTGLGLAAVHATVMELGGEIVVASEPGKGSAFTIWLPATDCPAGSLTPPAHAAVGGHGRILVVDDQPELRDLAGEMLTDLGYTVAVAVDGVDAVERFCGSPADLVLLDVAMPRLGGVGCAEELRALAPQLRIVVMTGCPEGPDLDRLRALGATVVRKPWRPDQLAAAVDAAMRAGTPPPA